MSTAVVRYRDETTAISCPYGHVERIVTGGEGGIANVHVVTVTKGESHMHSGYDEVYYVLSGTGSIILGEKTCPLRPGAAVVIPAGVPHALAADSDVPLSFVIFGSPAMSIDDARARPRACPDQGLPRV
ncbi:MAG: cupin domain-containing protein [Desulfobacterales bacterium]|jgi:mannose-6-phosphate isomerase-like protein (cupin superfamily)|nr:cupin domain-containing protein [Desulfobacterales bacterium]